MEVIGWIATAGVGAYVSFCLCAVLGGFDDGGLEAIPRMLAAGALGAVAWLVLIAWLSPLTIGWTP